jgi:hypothetical protein
MTLPDGQAGIHLTNGASGGGGQANQEPVANRREGIADQMPNNHSVLPRTARR